MKKKRMKCDYSQKGTNVPSTIAYFSFPSSDSFVHSLTSANSCLYARAWVCVRVDKPTNGLRMTNENFVLISLLGDKLLQLFKSVRTIYVCMNIIHTDRLIHSLTQSLTEWLTDDFDWTNEQRNAIIISFGLLKMATSTAQCSISYWNGC